MLQKLNNQGYTFTDNGRVIVVDKYGAVKRLTNLTLTTIGTTGPATLIGNVLNIPDYTEMYFGTVTSVGLSMPAAFTVTNSPVTTAGTLTVTGAGLVSQYIRGDGTLADFPGSTGGGSSVAYYLNGSVNQGIFGGNTYYQMSRTPVAGAGTNFTIGANGYIASFITDASDPSLISIPSGSWNIQFYMSANLSGGTPSFYVELYKYDGVSFTLVSTGVTTPENITGGTSVDLYYTSIAVPTTTLTVTDRLAVRVYVNNGGRTITFYTEGTNLAEITTTFTTGLTALNGLTAQVQYFTTGTSGTDFTISSATATHTFNLPVASALNTGKLSNTDWVTFNAKQDALSLTTTGSSGASTLIGSTLNVPAYTLSGLGGVPTSRTLTVNGTAYDLSADRSWSVGTVTSVAATAGTGISISGSPITGSGTLTITNTAPDQTVALTAGTGIGVSGTYPNFTITNTSPSSGGTVTSVAALTLGTTGTDLSSTVANPTTTPVITLNVPTASALNRGALSSADWTTFNGKVGGSGTTNYVPKFTASGTIGNSQIFDNGTNVGIGNTSPAAKLDVTAANGEIRSTGTAAAYTQYNAFITSGVNMRIGAYATNNGYLGTTTNHPFTIETNNTERARFTANGRLLIGTSTESTYELDLVGDFRSTLDANINGLTVGKGLNSVSGNSVFGVNAGRQITTGFNNTFIGSETGDKNTTANHNTSIGYRAGFNNTGGQNTFLGSGAGNDNTTGINNINVGYNAGRVTTGQFNVLIGSSTGIGLTTGNYNTIIGSQVTGLSASLSNTIILADGQGNQRLYINSSGNVGIGTASPSTKLTIFGTNPTFRVQGDGVSYYGGIDFWSSVSGSNRSNGSVGQYDGNGLYIGSGTGMRLTFTTNNGTEAMRLTSAGRLLIGTTTESTYILDANGTVRVQGTELRLDNATTGTINIYSNTPRVNFFSGGGYSIGRNGTAVELISGGSIAFYIGANQGYSLTAALGHVWYSAISGSAALGRLDTGGSLSIGKGGTAAVASSIVELSSTTKGFLPPRMTNAQMVAIATPASGLVVYDTTNNKLNVYDGTNWIAVH